MADLNDSIVFRLSMAVIVDKYRITDQPTGFLDAKVAAALKRGLKVKPMEVIKIRAIILN